jgi:hypothetical protein
MKARNASRVAWGLWATAVAFTMLFVVLVWLNRNSPGPLEHDEFPPITALFAGLFVMFPTLGAVIAGRHPSNAIGWMFCCSGIAMAVGACAQLYADQALFNGASYLPFPEVGAWLAEWLIPAGLFVTPMFMLFLFPDGRPHTQRWRTVLRALIWILVITFVPVILSPGRLQSFPSVRNPFGVTGVVGDFFTAAQTAFRLGPIVVFIIGVVALVSRARRSTGDRRLQIKWFAYVAAIMGVAFATSFVFSALRQQTLADVFFGVGALALFSVPIASTVAILRYRLYDIDVVINRTLVYGALTAILVAVYIGSVFVFQRVLSPLTPESDLAIAGSTLAVAALFRPARARVQGFIDRRFYRSKYDAQRTLELFTESLRDEIDLDALALELVGVAGRTVRPAHASLWLRPRREAAQ